MDDGTKGGNRMMRIFILGALLWAGAVQADVSVKTVTSANTTFLRYCYQGPNNAEQWHH
jgi:hypothetical protein